MQNQAHSTTEQSKIPSGRTVIGKGVQSDLGPIWRDRQWTYPVPPVSGVVEKLHGCEIEDPYRSLEILEDDSTQKYIREQNQVSYTIITAKKIELMIALSTTASFPSPAKRA